MTDSRGLLLLGNFLSRAMQYRTAIEDLAVKLRPTRELVCASSYRSGWLRGAHMLVVAMLQRRKCELAVVDLYSGRAFIWGEALSILLTALRCPFVLVMRGGGLPDLAQRYPRRVSACLRRAAAVAAPSRYLVERMRPYRTQVCLIPNPLNLDAYHFKLRERAQPRLIWLRAFHAIYNPLLAAKVVAFLAVDFPCTRLTMVGPDKCDGSLNEFSDCVAESGLADRVTVVGGVSKEDVPNWMESADIFLNTTSVDNTPISVLEAMASGLCVVSTNVGGIPYLLEDGHDALLVPPNDPQAMVRAVRRILTEPGLAEQLSLNARRKAEQFDWSAVLPQWQTLLNAVATGQRL